MRFCFIDEAGDSQPINSPTEDIQPLLVISGLLSMEVQYSPGATINYS